MAEPDEVDRFVADSMRLDNAAFIAALIEWVMKKYSMKRPAAAAVVKATLTEVSL